jgi:hypothetical protein
MNIIGVFALIDYDSDVYLNPDPLLIESGFHFRVITSIRSGLNDTAYTYNLTCTVQIIPVEYFEIAWINVF